MKKTIIIILVFSLSLTLKAYVSNSSNKISMLCAEEFYPNVEIFIQNVDLNCWPEYDNFTVIINACTNLVFINVNSLFLSETAVYDSALNRYNITISHNDFNYNFAYKIGPTNKIQWAFISLTN